MGLMDRDYYREKNPSGGSFQEIIKKMKDNPLTIIIIALILLLLIGLIL